MIVLQDFVGAAEGCVPLPPGEEAHITVLCFRSALKTLLAL